MFFSPYWFSSFFLSSQYSPNVPKIISPTIRTGGNWEDFIQFSMPPNPITSALEITTFQYNKIWAFSFHSEKN